MAAVDVLIPTFRRKTGLAVTLTGLLGQTFEDWDLVIADQTPADESYLESIELSTILRAIEWHGHHVQVHRRPERRGMAEQREFLLRNASAPYVHFLDDDILLDPPVLERMLRVLRDQDIGFVGCPATGLEYLPDERPHQQKIELWKDRVAPEPFEPGTIPWDRHHVNSAANPLHLEQQLVEDGDVVLYKVAWVGGANVLFDRQKLLDVGGFSFWPDLPVNHAGEEVVVQFLLLNRYGGCGLLPSGTYHLGLPTNVADRTHNATRLYSDLRLRLGLA